ncbi:MAG: branched-chain amino acid ABC transporter permease, partial [Clostridia bacterium]|nr:branched-chain amino acid ABC transporter permease [Clostridia bacterium]
MSYVLNLLTMAAIYTVLAVSLNLLVGYTGIFSVAHAALFGAGAYTSAILSTQAGWGFLPALAAAVAVAGLLSAAMALPSLRVAGDYFVVASFGMQIVIYNLFVNWDRVTRGPAGIPGIPAPDLFGWTVPGLGGRLALAVALAVLAVAAVGRLTGSPFGRVLRGIREDAVAARALGKDERLAKTWATVVAGCFAGGAGSLYAHHFRFIDPYSFTVDQSILILTMVVVGGSGTLAGSVAGALFLTAAPEALRFLALPVNVAAPLRQVLFGLALLICAIFRPQGILG